MNAASSVLKFFEIVGDTMIRVTHMVMLYAPIGVFGLMSYTVSRHGLGVLLPLAKLILSSFLATATMVFVILVPMVMILGKTPDDEVPQGHLRTVAHCLHDVLVRGGSAGEPHGRPEAWRHEVDRLLLDPARQHRQHERYGRLHGRLLNLRR